MLMLACRLQFLPYVIYSIFAVNYVRFAMSTKGASGEPQFPALCADNLFNALDKVRQRYRLEVDIRAQADRGGFGGGLAIADDEHVGYLLHLRVADLGVHALATAIGLGADASGLELRHDAVGVVDMAIGYGDDHGLHRREPDREGTREVLDQQRHEALRRAGDGAVDHDRAMSLTVLTDVLEFEVLRLN